MHTSCARPAIADKPIKAVTAPQHVARSEALTGVNPTQKGTGTGRRHLQKSLLENDEWMQSVPLRVHTAISDARPPTFSPGTEFPHKTVVSYPHCGPVLVLVVRVDPKLLLSR